MPPCVIQLIELVGYNSTGHPMPTGYLRKYIPGAWGEETIVETVDDLADALIFDTAKEAHEMAYQAVGLRPDGRPNRPLSAYTMMIHNLDRLRTATE